ncbi:MAG: zinc ribbon domain-containing protein [Chloroflexota bacterium]|nr:zinc ribbon domain-containing protein [Chloroflexota bacterium]
MLLVVAISFKLLLCLLCASIMHSKGRSYWMGFILGFLLNLIGLLIVAMIKPNAAFLEQQLQNGIMKKCPCCSEIINASAVVCRYCNREQPQTEVITDQLGR